MYLLHLYTPKAIASEGSTVALFLLACKHYSVINNKNVVYF
jgi:hypothetical protein